MQIINGKTDSRAKSATSQIRGTSPFDVEAETVTSRRKFLFKGRLIKDGKLTLSFWVAIMREW